MRQWRCKVERLRQQPLIFLTATAQGVTGVYPTAIGHIFLYNESKG